MTPDNRARIGVPRSIIFIAATLLALALIPVWASMRVTIVEDEILGTLEPARDLAADLAALHSRQMSSLQEYLLTASTTARDRYNLVSVDERRVGGELRTLLGRLDLRIDGLDLRIESLYLPLANAATAWQLGHVFALEVLPARDALADLVRADRARYEDVVGASTDLREALNREVQDARQRMDDARKLQLLITIGLVFLALTGTAAVAGLARRLQGLNRDAMSGQQEAVRARRDIDAVLEATADGVLSLDLAGRITRLNSAATRLLGISEESAKGRGAHDVIHGTLSDHAPEECQIERAFSEGQTVQSEEGVSHPRRDHAAVPVLWSLRPLVDGRAVRGAVLTVADLTKIKDAEARLREALNAREEMIAVVSHDLRSPLSSVSAATELLLDVPLDEAKRRKHLELVRDATDRMHRLIDDLLDVARIDAGRLPVRPAPEALDSLLEQARTDIDRASRDKGVIVTQEWADDLPVTPLDRDRILQVLQNLLGNALRHTPRGGKIAIQASVCEASPESAVEIAVMDNGSGIPAQNMDHLFDRFWRPAGAGRDGAGLGLAIVKGIVEAHGGTVQVNSTEGEGSRFSFRLPLEP